MSKNRVVYSRGESPAPAPTDLPSGRLVYLTEQQIESLLLIADRIEQFQHRNDAAMLRNLVQESE